jgi:hypothetical protein
MSTVLYNPFYILFFKTLGKRSVEQIKKAQAAENVHWKYINYTKLQVYIKLISSFTQSENVK